MLCYGHALLPVGLSDTPYQKAVKLYCARCEDIYSPKSSRHGAIDGAYFGTTFPHMLYMVYPNMVPTKSVPAGSSTSGAAAGLPGAQAVGTSSGAQTGGAEAALKAERYRPRICTSLLRVFILLRTSRR